MTSHPSVTDRLARLAPDQRAAATAPPGPILCVAPAGSGKTTTLVARVAWLIGGGVAPDTIAAITFNRRAAEELQERVATALAPLDVPARAVRVRTFHALGLEILRSTGMRVELVDRAAVLAELAPALEPATIARLDTAFSRLKLDLRARVDEVAADPAAGPLARAWVAYERALAERGALDFDDLVRRALDALERSPSLLARWRASCGHLLVDEAQDLDRSQLDLALLLAAPANRIFLVGDDDQSSYGSLPKGMRTPSIPSGASPPHHSRCASQSRSRRRAESSRHRGVPARSSAPRHCQGTTARCLRRWSIPLTHPHRPANGC